jgi:DNA replication protein DnaC
VVEVSAAPALPVEVEQLMRQLKMPYARALAPELLATAKAQRWEPVEVVKALLVEETVGRGRSMLAHRRKAAGFPTGKTFDVWEPAISSIPAPTQQALRTLEWVHRRENLVVCGPSGTGKTFDVWEPAISSIPAPTQQALRTLEWVHRRENLVVCGPSGTGKTFFLEALGQAVIETGRRVAWFTLEHLGALVAAHRADDTVTKAVARILRAELVVIDLCRYRDYAEVVVGTGCRGRCWRCCLSA